MAERTENDALIEVTRKAHGTHQIEDVAGLLISLSPLSMTNLEGVLPAPRRMRGDCTVDDISSLKAEAQRFVDAPVVYLVDNHPEPPKVIAILNVADANEPAWQDHRVILPFKHSDEWLAWSRLNDKAISQTQFAEHIEEYLHTCEEPKGAAMLELATNLEATKDVTFKSGIRLQDGSVKFENAENVRTSVVIPNNIVIRVPFYEGRAPRHMQALLRYRIESGKLTFRFKIMHLPMTLQMEAHSISTDVAEALGVPVIRGKPLTIRGGA